MAEQTAQDQNQDQAQQLRLIKKKLRSMARPGGRRRSSLPWEHPELSAQLPGGWPRGELTEMLLPCLGIGEFSLLAPALATLTQNGEWLALINPPHHLQATALQQWQWQLQQVLIVKTQSQTDTLWAMEQCLRSGSCGAVVSWVTQPGDRQLRRLKLAAEQGYSAGLLFRPLGNRQQRSPAALRLCLEPMAEHLGQRRLRSTIIKQRGRRGPPERLLTLL